ncbi:MAG TPA: gamma-glutamyl-gamma-aminobutyrate hydrolase family protein [Pseudonocardiaceae bacterium]
MASNVSEPVRPLVGITSYLERATFGVWQAECALLTRDYLDSVVRAGGIPVLLPPIGDGAAELVATLDALILSGGPDVSPTRYGERQHPRTEETRPERDAYEFQLVAAALGADLPVLAICRGAQVLNAALGGTLHQHLPERTGHESHRPRPGRFGTTSITLTEGSRAAAAVGPETTAQCHHHQAIATVAPDLAVTGTAEDGTVEAVEHRTGQYVVGVQWHPEQNSTDDRLITALVQASHPTLGRRP